MLKRLLLALTILLSVSPLSKGQGGNTTVTATVLDPNGAVYTSSQVNITFIEPTTPGKLPLLNGSTFQKQFTINSTDSFGHFTISLPDTGIIDTSSGTSLSQWSFRVIYSDRATSFVYVTPINCASNTPVTCNAGVMDISAPLKAAAALLPSQAGGGGAFTLKSPPCASSETFIMGGSAPTTQNTAFNLALTCNVTSSTVTQGGGGNIQVGAVAQFTFTQGAGGNTFVWPANFIDQPTIQIGPGQTTNSSFWFDGTLWHGQTFPASGGGGGLPAPPETSVQFRQTAQFAGSQNFEYDSTNDVLKEGSISPVLNPYTDIARYGAVNSSSTTTASCTNGSANITLAAALDFQDATKFPTTNLGNGIVIYKCGAATGLTTPPAPTVTPSGVTGGATTYNYKYVAEDQQGGLTAASPQGSTASGATVLGNNTVNLTSVTWNSTLNGENVYTCSGNCNIAVNAPIRIDGFANGNFDGNYTVIATNGGNQFTVYSPQTPTVSTETVAATAKVLACNVLTMPANTVNTTVETGGDTILRWIIYRNNVLAGYAQSRDPYYEDCGVTTPGGNFPSYVPTSPGSAVNKYLVTTIVSGAGTVNIVVANAAGATTSGQTTLHDNSKNLLAAVAAAVFSTPVYVSITGPFNAATIFPSGSVDIHLPYGVTTNQPLVITGSGLRFEGGQNNGNPSFQFGNIVNINGSQFAFPTVIWQSGHGNPSLHGLQFKNMNFNVSALGMEAFVVDNDSNTSFGLLMDNVGFANSLSASNVNVPAARIKGIAESSIGMPGNRNACSTAQIAPGPPCIRFSTVSIARNAGAAGTASIGRDVQINGFAVQGGGSSYQVDVLPWANSGGGSPFGATDFRFIDGLREQGKGPFLRVVGGAGGTFYFKYLDDDAPNAAPGNGFVDASNGASVNSGNTYSFEQWTTSVGGQVELVGPGTPTYLSGFASAIVPTLGTVGTAFSSVPGIAGPGSIAAQGTAYVGYLMGSPAAPNVVLGGPGSCGSNCVPSGTFFYSTVSMDIYGNASPQSPTTSVTTDGTKTVTVTPGTTSGQVLFNPIRGSSATNGLAAFSTGPGGSGLGGISYVDTTGGPGSSYIFSLFNLGAGTSASVGSSGLTSQQLIFTNGGFKDTHNESGLTANRTTTWPDGTGTVAKLQLAQTWSGVQTFSTPTAVGSGGTGGSTFTTNGILFGNAASALGVSAAGAAGTQCLVETNGGAPTFGACSGSTSTAWSSLSNPSADLSLAMGTNNSLFTHGIMTGARNAWEFVDGASTSTGSLGFFHTAASSTMKPFTATAQGTANGVQMSTAGLLAKIGTGGLDYPSLTNFPAACGANLFATQIAASPGCTAAVTASSAPANQFATAISAAGALSYAQPSFANLSGSLALAQTPLTTRGDLLTANVTPALSRIAIGPNGNCLTSNGTDPVWGSCAAGAIGGSGGAGQGAFFTGATALSSSANWLYAAASGHTFLQPSNGVDSLTQQRFTNTSPTGNFENYKDASGVTVFKIDVNGNASGTSFTGIAGSPSFLDLPQTAAPPLGTNSVRRYSPTSVPVAYAFVEPSGAANGFLRGTNNSNVVTLSFNSASGVGTCVNQVPTTLNDNAAPTCSPVVGAMFGSQAANLMFASPDNASGNPSFRAMVSRDIPPINLNSTSNGGVTSTLPFGSGGTNATTAGAAFNNLSPLTTLGDLLYENVTPAGARLAGNTTAVKQYLSQTGNGAVSAAPVWATIAFADVTGTLGIGSGGTGQTTASTAFNALAPAASSNAIIYSNGANTWTQLPAGGAGTLCLTENAGGTPTWGSCSGSASTVWSALTAPSASLAITMPVGDNTQFTYSGNTGASNLFSLIDVTGNTGTGAIFEAHSVGSSTTKPFQFTAQGTANGINMNTSGVVASIGTGSITANTLNQALNTTSPLTGGGTQTAALTLACATCVTSGSALTNNQLVLGSGGGQGTSSLAAGTTKQILVAGAPPTYIDFPDYHYYPSADCVNAVGASGWSTGATPAATCRAGTNNKEAYLLWGASDTAQFSIGLPLDWDTATNPNVRLRLASTDATNGHTIIMQIATACGKGDGSVTDDVAFNTAQSLGTITLNGNANRQWDATLSNITMTGCIAGGVLRLQLSRTTDTATNVDIYGLGITIPRLLTVQAN